MIEKMNFKDKRFIASVLAIICVVIYIIVLCVNNRADTPIENPDGDLSPLQVRIIECASALYESECEISPDDYDEYVAQTYIEALYGENPSDGDITDVIPRLFYTITGRKTTLVQKSVNVILSECDLPKTEFNALDFKLCGTTSDVVTEKSHGFYLSQNDPKYNDIPYSSGSITTSGCSPTALAKAQTYAANEHLTTPETVAAWATENGMVTPSVGTSWELFRTYPSEVGMSVTEKYASDADALENAMSGCKAMVTSMKKGDFTDNGHIIVIIGVKNGYVEVLDPASIYRSTVRWKIETILEQSNNYYWCIN